MKIKIIKTTMERNDIIFMNKKKNVLTFNGAQSDYSPSRFIFKVTDTIHGWPNELQNTSIQDATQYRIIIKDGEDIKRFIFKGQYPADIFRLDELIKDVESAISTKYLEEEKNTD